MTSRKHALIESDVVEEDEIDQEAVLRVVYDVHPGQSPDIWHDLSLRDAESTWARGALSHSLTYSTPPYKVVFRGPKLHLAYVERRLFQFLDSRTGHLNRIVSSFTILPSDDDDDDDEA